MAKFSGDNLPKVSLLTKDEIKEIHENALDILNNDGIVINHQETRDILCTAGAMIDNEQNIVKIPHYLVQKAIESIPNTFSIYNREGKQYFEIGGNNRPLYVPGGTCPLLLTATGDTRPATSFDLKLLTQIIDQLPQYDTISDTLVCTDVPDEVRELITVYTLLKMTNKPLFLGDNLNSKNLLELLSAIRGTKKAAVEKPCAVYCIGSFSPLKWEAEACESILSAARSGIPICFYAGPVLGMASPVTIAGSILQHTVEVLAGITLGQIVCPGLPTIYGVYPSSFDMKIMNSPQATIEAMMMSCGCGLMGKYYGIPTMTFAGASDSKLVDCQSGIEDSLSLLLASQFGFDVIVGIGPIDTYAEISMEKMVIDAEIIGMIKHYLRGFEVNKETLARNVIKEVGGYGNFLQTAHTCEWFKGEMYFPSEIIDRNNRTNWEGKGKKSIVDLTMKKIDEIIKQPGNRLYGEKLDVLNMAMSKLLEEKGGDPEFLKLHVE